MHRPGEQEQPVLVDPRTTAREDQVVHKASEEPWGVAAPGGIPDDCLTLRRQGLVEENEVMFKSRKPQDLKERIENAKKGIFDENEGGEEEEE